jgi:hypothetical protein
MNRLKFLAAVSALAFGVAIPAAFAANDASPVRSDSTVAPTTPLQAAPTGDQRQVRKQHRAERKARRSPDERKAAKAKRNGAEPPPLAPE